VTVRTTKHDWPSIRRDYVEGIDRDGVIVYPTMDEVAERHKVMPNRVREQAAKRGWFADRERLQARIAQARETKRAVVIGRAGADFDSKVLRFAGRLLGDVERTRKRLTRKDANVDPLELSRIGLAARHCQTLAKVALGEEIGDDGVPLPLPAPGSELPTAIIVQYRKVPRAQDG
jgi:hypothetical protein